MKRIGTEGFTLIELIVTIVLSAIAMAALMPLLSQTFLRSYEPRQQLREGLRLQTAMEELIARSEDGLDPLRQFIGAEGSTINGDIIVQDNHYIAFSGNNESLIVHSNNLLKVTLRSTQGEFLTRLFTEPL